MDENTQDDMDKRLEGLSKVMDGMDRITEAVSGYKIKLINKGFSEGAAEEMAKQFHALIIQTLVAKRAQPNRAQRRARQ